MAALPDSASQRLAAAGLRSRTVTTEPPSGLYPTWVRCSPASLINRGEKSPGPDVHHHDRAVAGCMRIRAHSDKDTPTVRAEYQMLDGLLHRHGVEGQFPGFQVPEADPMRPPGSSPGLL